LLKADQGNIFGYSSQVKMHPDEIDIDAALVKWLLVDQFPHLAEKPIKAVRSIGTVNAIYRLGDDLCVRLPRVPTWAKDIEKEWTWLPEIALHVSLDIPKPVVRGNPVKRYPYPWAVYRWIGGSPYRDDLIKDEQQTARALANFIRELRSIDPTGAPRGGRAPLAELDAVTRAAIRASKGAIALELVSDAWARALETPPWDGKPVWIHGDLLRSNLLVRNGRLCAVIDFGGAGVGDPAADVVPAWSVFNQAGRETFRTALAVDKATWARARGYALHQALLIIPYYSKSNPKFVSLAVRTVDEILKDL
jgi:aminoglycoside phosphotransferase (APT) family kinase protein